MKTTLICVITFFSVIMCIAQSTSTNYIFGNSQNSTYQSGNFMSWANNLNNNTTLNYTFNKPFVVRTTQNNYYSPILTRPIKLNYSIGFNPSTTHLSPSFFYIISNKSGSNALNPGAYILFDLGRNNIYDELSASEIVVGSFIQVLNIISCFQI
ncbi:hypothetical protein D1816_06690 [Aquimarina sp. AD10]|uniref:hypothetical protein n=1 Tax=Aquimarina sp. AD10 TaxID=1714849 RepID=UPI000E4B67A3|nr:hypothetical protein [Aquimarina sp. AD10]AXT60053.1 hypothetical protein D1816_06690 [Aquimarina sp. AD10]RKM96195.1 hypothetical protein D7033_15880 [Aquimarina sp. AD10]